jgi:hypothetical protein
VGDRCFWQRLLIILTFELFFDVPEQADGNWTQIAFPWSDMNRAEWADPGGLFQLDPGLVVGYGFGLGLDQGRPSGVLWVDDIELASDTSPFAPPAQEPEVPAEPASPPAVGRPLRRSRCLPSQQNRPPGAHPWPRLKSSYWLDQLPKARGSRLAGSVPLPPFSPSGRRPLCSCAGGPDGIMGLWTH